MISKHFFGLVFLVAFLRVLFLKLLFLRPLFFVFVISTTHGYGNGGGEYRDFNFKTVDSHV